MEGEHAINEELAAILRVSTLWGPASELWQWMDLTTQKIVNTVMLKNYKDTWI